MNWNPTDDEDEYPLDDGDELSPSETNAIIQREEAMHTNFPEYSQESRNAGNFLGMDYPYVPGDD